MSHYIMLLWYYLFFRPKRGSEGGGVHYLGFCLLPILQQTSRCIDHSQIAVRFNPYSSDSCAFVPRIDLKFSWFLNKLLIWLKNSLLEFCFLKLMKWLFALQKTCISFSCYHLEWLKSINVILEWLESKNPEAVLSNVAFFHMKWLFAQESPFRLPKKCTFQRPRIRSALNKKTLTSTQQNFFLKAKSIFSMGNYF